MASKNGQRGRGGRGGRLVAIAMAVLWVLILVAVYVVIVQLKLGGEEGIMREDARPSEIATESENTP
jgi:cell division protein FtsN